MDGYFIINSIKEDGICRQGVAFVIEKELSSDIIDYNQYSERMISLRFVTSSRSVTFLQVYAPASSYDGQIVETFYNDIQEKIETIPKSSTVYLLAHFNANPDAEFN